MGKGQRYRQRGFWTASASLLAQWAGLSFSPDGIARWAEPPPDTYLSRRLSCLPDTYGATLKEKTTTTTKYAKRCVGRRTCSARGGKEGPLETQGHPNPHSNPNSNPNSTSNSTCNSKSKSNSKSKCNSQSTVNDNPTAYRQRQHQYQHQWRFCHSHGGLISGPGLHPTRNLTCMPKRTSDTWDPQRKPSPFFNEASPILNSRESHTSACPELADG